MKKNLGLSLMACALLIIAVFEPITLNAYLWIMASSCVLGTAGYFLWKGTTYTDVPEYIDPETGEVHYGLSVRQLAIELALKAYHKLRLPVAFLLFAVSMMVFYWKMLA